MDLRTRKLAKLVVNYALGVKKDDNVIISGGDEAKEFIIELYKEVILRGAHPHLRVGFGELNSFFYRYAKEHQLNKFPEFFDDMVKKSQKYIGISTTTNTKMLSGCDAKKIAVRQKVMHPISTYICNSKPHMNRATVGFPCLALAQEAEMDLTEYKNFVYDACLQDWKAIGKFMNRILKKFKKGRKVHLIGEGVDLKFDIHGDKACSDLDGDNVPMGEIFMAPVRESLNGWIKFDYPAIRSGKEVNDIYLKFENGKVVESKASKNEEFLKEMINLDENSSYVGEFGIGMNPKINKFTKNLLFDEKMNGTIHLALGQAYLENGGGNDSALHWDIVKSMKKAKIVLDGHVVQSKGKWLV